MQYEQHPIALKIAPGTMPEEEFNAFVDDIRARGQLLPIVLYEGKILSGWHRYRAVTRIGAEPKIQDYTGSDPHGLVIALELMRRRHGPVQRALAAARLVLDLGLTQDDASKKIGISKVHTNLVVQALRSNNTRIIKRLEDPQLTRGELHDELVDCGIINPSAAHTPTAAVAAPPTGGDAFTQFTRTVLGDDAPSEFDRPPESASAEEDDDFLGGRPSTDDPGVDLEGILGAPPSAAGKVIEFNKRPAGQAGTPGTGTKPSHPERRPKETVASQFADRFRGMTEADQIASLQLMWPVARKLLKAAGLSIESPAEPVAPPKTRKAPKVGTPADIAAAAIDDAKASAAA